MPVIVQRLGIVGAGQMGCGIAQVAAQAGIEVTLVDAQPAIVLFQPAWQGSERNHMDLFRNACGSASTS